MVNEARGVSSRCLLLASVILMPFRLALSGCCPGVATVGGTWGARACFTLAGAVLGVAVPCVSFCSSCILLTRSSLTQLPSVSQARRRKHAAIHLLTPFRHCPSRTVPRTAPRTAPRTVPRMAAAPQTVESTRQSEFPRQNVSFRTCPSCVLSRFIAFNWRTILREV